MFTRNTQQQAFDEIGRWIKILMKDDAIPAYDIAYVLQAHIWQLRTAMGHDTQPILFERQDLEEQSLDT